MARAIKLSDELHAKAKHRTPPRQIEHWARLGKIAEENPDLPPGFVKDILTGIEEVEAGDVSGYTFG